MRVKYIENNEQWASEFTFYSEIKVRFSETDMYGHLNNTVPFIFFEQARIEFLEASGIQSEWNKRDGKTIIVVADLQCDFLKQAYFGDTIKVYVKAQSVGTSSVDIHYLGKNQKGEPVFVGRGALVQLNPETGKTIAFTDEEKHLLLGK